MNKTELILTVAEETGYARKDVEAILNASMERIKAAMASGDKVQLIGFGSFEVKERAARMGRNPRTGEATEIPAAKVPVFKPGKAMKDIVNG